MVEGNPGHMHVSIEGRSPCGPRCGERLRCPSSKASRVLFGSADGVMMLPHLQSSHFHFRF
jgi:hypothetical protein